MIKLKQYPHDGESNAALIHANSLRSGLYFYSNLEHWKKIDTAIGEKDARSVDWGDKAKEALKSIEKLVKKHFSA